MMRLGHLPTEEELKRMVAEVGPGFFVSRIWCSSGMIWYLFIYLFRWTKTKMEQLSWTNFCTWWLTGQKWNIDFRNQNKRHCARSFMFWYFFSGRMKANEKIKDVFKVFDKDADGWTNWSQINRCNVKHYSSLCYRALWLTIIFYRNIYITLWCS